VLNIRELLLVQGSRY